MSELHIDRGYLASQWVKERHEAGERVIGKPWPVRNGAFFPKTAFRIDLAKNRVTWASGQLASIAGSKAQFSASDCDNCAMRGQCSRAAAGRGRSIAIHDQESLLIELRGLMTTTEGRQRLRERVGIEHSLAHLVRRQGPRARYVGTRKNTFDVRRTAAVENLHTLDRLQRAA